MTLINSNNDDSLGGHGGRSLVPRLRTELLEYAHIVAKGFP